ncbi:MAG: OmpA family protein [Myxococcota bacterium]
MALLLMGCGGAAPSAETADSSDSARGRRGSTLTEMARVADNRCNISTLYFSYDSSELDEASRRTLISAAGCLRQGFARPIHLVGSADPRGTEEYNLALGERRARTVRQYLRALGVDPDMVSFGSVGEEMASGTNEATWALDRHVTGETIEDARGLDSPTARLSH